MTRGTFLRALAGFAGAFLIGTGVAGCAASGADQAAEPPLTAPSSPSLSSTPATSPAPTTRTTPATHALPKPRSAPRHLTPTTTEARTRSTPPARPKPVTSHAAPPRTTHPAPPPKPSNCDPAYPGVCLKDGIGDYDCAGGSGNGPNYVSGPISVRAPDPFRLDADHDGIGCE